MLRGKGLLLHPKLIPETDITQKDETVNGDTTVKKSLTVDRGEIVLYQPHSNRFIIHF